MADQFFFFNASLYRQTHQSLNQIQKSFSFLINDSFIRKRIITWIQIVSQRFKFSESTLYLSFSILDRLIVSGFNWEEVPFQILGIAILLICSKFNEVNPLSFKSIENTDLIQSQYPHIEIVQLQSKILQRLGYMVIQDGQFYQSLAELEKRLKNQGKKTMKNLMKTVVKNPILYRHGLNILLQAVENFASRTLPKAQHLQTHTFHQNVIRIMSELAELHYQH